MEGDENPVLDDLNHQIECAARSTQPSMSAMTLLRAGGNTPKTNGDTVEALESKQTELPGGLTIQAGANRKHSARS